MRPRIVAFLYVMLLIGMVASALAFGMLLGRLELLSVLVLLFTQRFSYRPAKHE